MKWTRQPVLFQFLVYFVAGWLRRNDELLVEYLREENRVLRELLGAKRLVFSDAQRRRLAVKAHALGRAALSSAATLVTPDTLLRWYRQLIARKYDGSSGCRPGRRRTAAELRDLIVRMAKENSTWGYTRICGALHNVGHEVARNTIARVLVEAGLEPAPERSRRGCWSTFLKAHVGEIVAIDFFAVEVATLTGLVRYLVLFAIDLESRQVAIAGISHDPHQAWVINALRALLDPVDGLLRHARYLIHDRDPLFGSGFKALVASCGVTPIRLPSRSPNLNAFAERFIGSIRRECLDRVVPLGETHLRRLVAEYVEHYHLERNHQGRGNELLCAAAANDDGVVVGAIGKRERLGGLLNFYHRGAA